MFVVIVVTISEKKSHMAENVIVPLMVTESDISNALNTGVDDGKEIENGIKIKLL